MTLFGGSSVKVYYGVMTHVKAPIKEQFELGPWLCTAVKSHILVSEGDDREKFEAELKLPHVPEMIFAENILRLEHKTGFSIEFNALDALKLVDPENDVLKVANAVEWQQARSDCEHIKQVIKPFDWTFSTDYKGTIFGGDILDISETSDRIDTEKLKQRDKILFYADIMLFEDELHDNGCSILSAKMRVMPGYFFVLMRQYLRVDGVLIRINDTRLFHEAENDFILREYSCRERATSDIQISPHLLTDANEVIDYLVLKKSVTEKLRFPSSVADASANMSNTSVTSSSGATGLPT